MPAPIKLAYDAAIGLLARREHSRKELAQKLLKRRYKNDEVEAALDKLEQAGVLSDQRFAEIYAEHRYNKGYGPERIRMELKTRGVAPRWIELSLKDLNWMESLSRVMRQRYDDAMPSDSAGLVKLNNYLYRRGYTHELIRQFFKD